MRVAFDSCFSFYIWLNLSQAPVLENLVHFFDILHKVWIATVEQRLIRNSHKNFFFLERTKTGRGFFLWIELGQNEINSSKVTGDKKILDRKAYQKCLKNRKVFLEITKLAREFSLWIQLGQEETNSSKIIWQKILDKFFSL